MTEPNTPGAARKQGLRRSRWIATGAAVGAATFLTGIIAGVNGADATGDLTRQISSSSGARVPEVSRSYDGYGYREHNDDYDDDDYGDDDYGDDDFDRFDDDRDYARPFTPQQPSGSASGTQLPSFRPQPQTRSGGS